MRRRGRSARRSRPDPGPIQARGTVTAPTVDVHLDMHPMGLINETGGAAGEHRGAAHDGLETRTAFDQPAK